MKCLSVRSCFPAAMFASILVLSSASLAFAERGDNPVAEPVEGIGNPHDETAELVGIEELLGGSEPPGIETISDDGPPVEYALTFNCVQNYPGEEQAFCPPVRTCDDPTELRYTVWARRPPETLWRGIGTTCLGPEVQVPRPVVTPDLVLREVRRIGLPALQIQVQPAGATLVNFDTIFYAEPQPFARTVQLLGYTVDVEATPAAYGWSFGDGQTATTDGPGAPYPSKDVVHSYASADVVERPSVDVTYQIRFRVDGAEWQSIDETVTAAGPTVGVEVKEAAPALSGN